MNIEKRIDEIMARMTLHEKVEMCHGNSKFASAGIPSQGIDELTMSDGPHGVREEGHRTSGRRQAGITIFAPISPRARR